MSELNHQAIATWERRWLAVAGLMSLVFVMLIAYSLATEGTHIAQRSGRTTPEQLTSHELFASPGVTPMGNGHYQVAVVGQTFAFSPSEIRLPEGAIATFLVTSRDVLHGFQIQNTNVNVEMFPGEVSSFQYTFNDVGEYRLVCNEYCGISHQNMLGKIIILPSTLYAQSVQAEALATVDSGQAVFSSYCASCHQANGQGLAGVFPPLAQHMPELYAADRDYLPKLLLYGLQNQITVLGSNYNGQMPAWAQLSDEELADVLNYSLQSWGNEAALPADFTAYTAADISQHRELALSSDDIYALRQALELE